MTTLNTNFTIEDGQLYLCYYDPDNDQLKELNEGNVKLKILPFQETIKRFYLVSNEFESGNLIRVITKVDGPQKYSYKIKTACGKDNPEYIDFDSADSSCAVLYDNLEKQWENAVPVDIWIQSLNKNEVLVNLDISVSLEDTTTPINNLISCAGSTESLFFNDASGDKWSLYINNLVILQNTTMENIFNELSSNPYWVSRLLTERPNQKYKITNLISQSMRFKFTYNGSQDGATIWGPDNENPTWFYYNSDNSGEFGDSGDYIAVCLKPIYGENISCIGSSNILHIHGDLPYETTTGQNIRWNVEVNGILYNSNVGSGGSTRWMEEWLSNNSSITGVNGIYGSNSGISGLHISIPSNGTNKRIRLIPTLSNYNHNTIITGTTYFIDDNGIINFCLSNGIPDPEENIEIPDEGDIDSSDTNAEWGFINIHTDSSSGIIEPSFTKTSSLSGVVNITTAASFVGQSILSQGSAFTLNPDTPTTGVTLQFANTPSFKPYVHTDGDILSLGGGGGTSWDSPISVLFDKDVSAVVITGGIFDNINSTYIKCFDRLGNVVGVASNKALGIDDYGFSSGSQSNIAGFSFYINSLEGSGLGLRTIKFL